MKPRYFTVKAHDRGSLYLTSADKSIAIPVAPLAFPKFKASAVHVNAIVEYVNRSYPRPKNISVNMHHGERTNREFVYEVEWD